MQISITNTTGCRNRGCEALVVSLINELQKAIDNDLNIKLHTNDPLFDRYRLSNQTENIFSYLTVLPNHTNNIYFNKFIYFCLHMLECILPISIKNIQVDSIKQIINSDLIVATGGDIFTSDYNNLQKHLSFITIAKNKKVYLCAHTIGPFSKRDEHYFLKIAPSIDLITVRESTSYEYLKTLDLNIPVYKTADVAFLLPTLDKNITKKYLKDRFGLSSYDNLVSISISQGIIKYSKLNKSKYYNEFAQFINYLNENGNNVLLIPHVLEKTPSNNDLFACEEVYSQLQYPENNRIILGEPDATTLKGIIGLSKCLIGTRTHSTIASLSQGVPTISIAYSRKAYGIMSDIFGKEDCEKLTIDVKKLSCKELINAYKQALKIPPKLDVIVKMKELAKKNFTLLNQLLEHDAKR